MNASDREAVFERWIREHGRILYRVARGFASGADRDDLLQELLLATWKAIPDFRGDAKPSTFLYRVAHHAALTWKRGARNYARKVERYAAERDRDGPPARTAEALERLYGAIRELPELDRSLVLLSLDGLTYREVAAIHGLTETNVGARLTRIRARLARRLQEDGP